MSENQINCIPDGKVTKIIIKEGSGDNLPAHDQEVDVTYIGTLQDGTEFDRCDTENEPFQFFIGSSDIIKGWSAGVATMKKGERSKFTMSSEYGYGENGSPPKIPGNATLVFEIELIDFRDRTKSKYDYEPEERVPMGIKLKEEGNVAFRAGDLKEAQKLYCEATEFLDGETGEGALTAVISLHMNLSLIYFKEEDFKDAIDQATKAIDKDPQTVKAYYRRGQAYMKLKDYELAIKDYGHGLKIDEKNSDLKKALNEAKKGLKACVKKQQGFYSKMFSGDVYDSPQPSKEDYSDPSNPRVFFDIKIGENEPERIEFELFANAAPKSAENFRCLCTGEKGKNGRGLDLHYKGNKFHRLIEGFMLQGGDFERFNGTGGSSIYGDKYDDEPFLAKHTKRGLLSMANSGPNTNGSQFFLTFKPTDWLNDKHIVFGQTVKNIELLDKIEKIPAGGEGNKPEIDIQIVDCGQC